MPNSTTGVFKKIRKRNGRLHKFRPEKIENAIASAGRVSGEFDEKTASKLSQKVIKLACDLLGRKSIPTVEQIQDLVEDVLLNSSYHKTAKEYILYRDQRERVREISSSFNRDLINKYLKQMDWQVKENSNMGFSLQGLNNYISSELSKAYWLNEIYPKEIRDAHSKGDFHVHDLSALSVYCVGWDLWDLLAEGFTGVPEKTESKPANHLRTALGQVINFFYTLQGEAAGAQAFSNFDTLLAPFIRYDKLTYKEIKQTMQEFLFNINVPTRVGFQSPFTNVTLDLTPSPAFKDQNVIIGGQPKEEKYGDFQKEMDLFNKAFFEVMLEGDARGRVFTFPIPTYNITKDFDWDNPNIKLLWDITARYGIPYFSNFINSDMKPEDSRSMCCFSGKTDIVCKYDGKLRFTDLFSLYSKSGSKIEVPINGEWVKANPVRVDFQGDFYRIKLRNGSEYTITNDHLNPVLGKGDVRTEDLIVGDKLKYNFNKLQCDGVGSYELGKFIGLYLAEGSHLDPSDIQFSLGDDEGQIADFITNFIEKNFAAHTCVQPNSGKSISVFANSSMVRHMIDRFVSGKAVNKKLIYINDYSNEMLQGILDGWVLGDGKNNGKEAYTSSLTLARQMRYIARILGISTNIRTTERVCNLGSKEYKSTIYTVHFCDLVNGNIYTKNNEDHYCEITSIEKTNNRNKVAFCVEVQDNDPYFQMPDGLVTHNCRLRLNTKELSARGGGLFGANPLTGSIGVVTVNLPKLAHSSSNGWDFMRNLGKVMDLAKESLEIKRKVLEEFTDKDLYPYTKFYLRGVKKRFNKYWFNHFSTIGLVGMNEACINLLGEDITTKRGLKFANKVLDFMRNRLVKYQKDTGNNYNLEATPAEGTSYRLAIKDKKLDSSIICANEEAYKEGAEPFYTNSSHLPVGFTDDIFKTLDMQDSLQIKYTGGTVVHLFIGEKIDDPEMVKKLVKVICENYKLPYFTITPTFSVCPKHGYIAGEHQYCPKCDEEIIREINKNKEGRDGV